MKTRRYLAKTLVIIAIALSLVLSACAAQTPAASQTSAPAATSASTESSAPAATKLTKLGFCMNNETNEYFITVKKGLDDWCAANGVTLVYTGVAAEESKLRTQVENMVSQGVQCVADFSCVNDGSGPVSDWCAEQGVPYICVEFNVGPNSHFYGVSNEEDGKAVGQGCVDWINANRAGSIEGAMFCEMWQPDLGPDVQMRTSKAVEVIKAAFPTVKPEQFQDIQAIAQVSDNAWWMQKCADYMTKYSTAKDIYFFSLSADSMYPACKSAADRLGIGPEKVHFFGVDCTSTAIARFKANDPKDFDLGEASNHPDLYGQGIGELAQKLVAGEKVDGPTFAPHDFVNAANVNEIFPD